MRNLQFIEVVGIFIFAWVLWITLLFFLSMDDMKKKCRMKKTGQQSLLYYILYVIFAFIIYICIAVLYDTYDLPNLKKLK
jgi:NADH:ubiquinone oxidoreductase subunit 6 (subunit J)